MNKRNSFFLSALFCTVLFHSLNAHEDSATIADRVTKLGIGTTMISFGGLAGWLTHFLLNENDANLGAFCVTTVSAGLSAKLVSFGVSSIAHGIKGSSMNLKNHVAPATRIFGGSSLMGASAFGIKAINGDKSIPLPAYFATQAINAGIFALGAAQTLKGVLQIKKEIEESN